MPPRIDYSRLRVYQFGMWVWQVNENQSYLGRMILRLDRPETRSLSYCNAEEWVSLHENIRAYELLVQELFSPDRFNYSQMGNEFPQLHVHTIPRYASDRTWRQKVFHDNNWGNDWAPASPSPLTLEETYDFASWLGAEILKRAGKQ